MAPSLTILSSMATRLMLAELAGSYRNRHGLRVELEAVGGVDAARRVEAGEAFDLVVLADAALARLVAAGFLDAGTVTPIACADVAVAVREGSALPVIETESALREAVLAARTIGYSTGPSGQHLLKVFERWGIAQAVAPRIVQAPPGVPVGQLIAEGAVDLGFQQLSELIALQDITVVGSLPPGVQITTTFTGAVCMRSGAPEQARALLRDLADRGHDALRRRHGMAPV